MEITVVQSNFTPAFHSASGTATVALPNPVTSGNTVLIAFAGSDSQEPKTVGSITDNKSNTGYEPLTFDNTVTTGQGFFILTNVTNGPSAFDVPFTTASASNILLGVYELSGVSSSDFANLETSGFAETFDLSFPTTAANEMVFAILSNANGSGQTAVTMTNGLTLDETDLTGSTFFSAIGHMALPTAGSNSIQGSTTAADEWNVSIVTLKAATGSPGAALAGAASDTMSATGVLTAPAAPFEPILVDSASHAGGSTAINMGTGPNTGTGDPVDIAFMKIKQDMADINTMMGQLFPSRSVQTPTTGFAIAAAVGVTKLILNPAGTLAAGTVTLPPNPADQQPFVAATSQTITAFTANTSDGATLNGAPGTLAANTSVRWVFEAALNTWFREQ
jgi:hypothetical protein